MRNQTKTIVIKPKFSLAEMYLKYGMFFILLVLMIFSGVMSPTFFTLNNLFNVIRYMSIMALVAYGQTLILILGKIDLSVGSVMELCGCITCLVVRDTGSLLLALLAGIAIGALCGLLNGFIISRFHMPAFIMTLATMQVARGAVLLLTNAVPVSNMGEAFKQIGQGTLFNVIPMPIVIMVFCFIFCWVLLNRSKFGRHIYACGGNEQAAVASGINAMKVTVISYVIMGVLTAMSGIVLMSYINSGQPAGAMNYEMDAITAAIVGGTSFSGGIGTIQGTFVGCLIVGVLDNIMNLLSVSSYWQQIVRGVIIAAAVILDMKSKELVMNKRK